MKIKDLILKLQEQDPESEIQSVGLAEYGFQEIPKIVPEECFIREDNGFVQLIISGESLK